MLIFDSSEARSTLPAGTHTPALQAFLSWGTRRPDQRPVVDRAALGTLGPDGGGVLRNLGRDHASTKLQDLLITKTWTLQDQTSGG